MLRVLAAKGAVVTKVGGSTIGTTPATAYDVTLSPSLIASQKAALGVPSADSAEVQEILGNGGCHLPGLRHLGWPVSAAQPAHDGTRELQLTRHPRVDRGRFHELRNAGLRDCSAS
jgi:hypothetical protein